jgi:hypothetical protein
MKRSRIYLDTSVFGSCFDEEFLKESLLLFEEIKNGRVLRQKRTPNTSQRRALKKVRELQAQNYRKAV